MRGPIRTRRSSPVFVVETRVCFLVSAERWMVSVGLGRPVSRILLYPAIHLRERTPGLPWGAAPTMSGDRTNLACSHRWFTWPVPRGIPPVGSYPTLSPITCAV
jgi:hypothetical protein